MTLTNSVDSRFMLADLTGEVQQLPNLYGLVNSLNLFTAEPTTQTSILLDITKSDISLLDAHDRTAGDAEASAGEVVSQIAFPLIPLKVVESITPEEIQGVRQAGTANTPETEARVRAKKLAKMKAQFDITAEFLKVQALKGIVKDANGKLFVDLFKQFGVTKKTVEFDLDNASADIDASIEELVRHMEDNAAAGTIVDGQDIIILVDDVFFRKLTNHAKLRDAYLAQQTPLAYQQMTGSLRTGQNDGVQRNMNAFQYRGVKFVQYNGKFKDKRGVDHKLVGVEGNTKGSGHAFPNVTMLPSNDLFKIAYAPCAKMGYANTLGQPLYVFEYERPRDEGIDFEGHSILMPYCTRPQLLVDVVCK